MNASRVDAQHDVTERLAALRGSDDPGAWETLVPLVYAELRAIAHRQLRRERTGHTLDSTALVHEAYLRLVNQRHAEWRDRAHFFGIAARVMRQVLIDYARHRRAARRDGALRSLPVGATSGVLASAGGAGEALALADQRAEELLELDDALTRLAVLDQRLSRVVECRFFGGLTEEETAAALGVTARTVRRDWIKAKGWLQRALQERGG